MSFSNLLALLIYLKYNLLHNAELVQYASRNAFLCHTLQIVHLYKYYLFFLVGFYGYSYPKARLFLLVGLKISSLFNDSVT